MSECVNVQFNQHGCNEITFVVTAKMSSRTLVLFCCNLVRVFFSIIEINMTCVKTYRVELSDGMTKNVLHLFVLHSGDDTFLRSFFRLITKKYDMYCKNLRTSYCNWAYYKKKRECFTYLLSVLDRKW